MRHTGIPIIGDVPWGTHFCQFYQDPRDLTEILVPYFRAGLENHEFCMWITSEPLLVREARQALSAEIPNLDDYIRQGQIEILDYRDWYTAGGGFDSARVLQGWVAKLEAALERGFGGLRLTGNTFWLEKADWQSFADYEAAVDGVIGRYPMLAICTYSLAKCGAAEIMDVVANHAFALIKRAGEWQVIQSAERKRMEASLRATEERYSALFQQMTEGFALHEIICGEDGAPCDYRFLEINPAFERLTGLSRGDVLGRTMRQVLPGDDPKWIETYGAVALTGEPARFDNYSPELQRHYSVLAYRTAPRQFAVLFTDVTEHKRAEQALREAEAKRAVTAAVDAERRRLHEIMDALPMMVCLITPDYHLPFANRMFRETFGEPQGRTCYNYIFDRAEPCPQCESLMPLETGRPRRWSNPYPGNRLVEKHDFPFTDTDGSPMILEVDVDITERRRAETELARYRDHLEELVRQRTGELARSNQELEQFAYVASHDLQEPLRAVTGYLGLLEQQTGAHLDQDSRHQIAGAVQGAARMHALITGLLALSQVGRRGETIQAADLGAALDQALERLRAGIAETGARITRDTLPTLPVDAAQMVQLFQNLVGNALKFRAGGTPEIHIGAREREDRWVLSVSDNGIGIEPQYFERIFMIFQRLHTRRLYQGTGIGLAICKKIVERHGGAIWVESIAGQGATFCFTIPKPENP